ncbi:hypothetical protein R5N98_02865 [Tenacibaculum maritimum]|uniref:hypothetical protein n=1 Tax=Tenacibaculum maritimum TaxID=107401 RepID=UPI0038762120
MHTIKVIFKWTELIRVTDTKSSFKKAQTDVQDYTFEQLEQIHARNYKGNGTVYRNYAYLNDDWRHSSQRIDLETLKSKVENRDVVYEVELDYAWLRLSPIVKTKDELIAFGNALRACGSLD